MSEMHSTEIGVLPAGTVVRFIPDPSQHSPRWCREGIAIAQKDGRLHDTFWGSGSEAHIVREVELPSVEVLFHMDDYDELDKWRPDRQKWLTYAPDDRKRITMQHGLQERLFIRKGALPHRETMLAQARQKVEDAEGDVRRAEGDLRWAREDLAALLAAPLDCTCRPSLCAREECPACSSTSGWQECKALPARLA